MNIHLFVSVGKQNLFATGEDHPFPFHAGSLHRGVVTTHHDILRRRNDRRTIRRTENVVCREHQGMRLDLGFQRKGQVYRHLVAVEVCIESPANERVQFDRISFDQNRFKRLDTHPVKRRSTVQKHRVILDYLFQNIPYFLIFAFEHFLCTLDRVGVLQLFQASNNKWLEQFQCNLLRQTALVQPQVRTNHDHAPGRIIDTFTEQVFAESSLLPLDHVCQRFEWSIA
jgi:hypothetical protein